MTNVNPHDSAPALVLVTRPQASGSALAARLCEAGRDALWWPAFDLLPPEDPMALKSRIARLAEFDLAIFVSPAAVHAFASAMRRMYRGSERNAWPLGTTIAAVGAATRDAALDSLPRAREARIICPAGDSAADGGSEALIGAIRQLPSPPRAVLLVRAQAGRQRLVDWLQGHGAGVEEAVAYRRLAHVPEAEQWAALRTRVRAGARLAVLYTSSEAVAIVARQFQIDAELADAYADSIALSIHDRITRELRARGFTDVRSCGMEVDAIELALRDRTQPPPAPRTIDILL